MPKPTSHLAPQTVRPTSAFMFEVVAAIDAGCSDRSAIFRHVYGDRMLKVKAGNSDRWRALDHALGHMTRIKILRYDNHDTGTWSVVE